MTFLSVTDMYVRTHAHQKNRFPIQSLLVLPRQQVVYLYCIVGLVRHHCVTDHSGITGYLNDKG